MDIEVKHHKNVVKCPHCKAPIHLSLGKFLGGWNDSGGVIIQCKKCDHIFACPLSNPDDASAVGKGGKKLATWKDDFPQYLAEQYKIDPREMSSLEINLVFGHEDPPVVPWQPAAATCYKFQNINLEAEASTVLHKYKNEIKTKYEAITHAYVKSMISMDKSFVQLSYNKEGKEKHAVFAKNIKGEKDLQIEDLYMIDHSDANLEFQIDGIYKRDEIMVFLERLLNRWRYTAREVLMVVPFIGFNFKNSEPKLYELWNWLSINVDPEKTRLLTRKGTFNLYKTAQDHTGVSFDVLVDLGLLEPFIEKMAVKDAKFFQQSHAKYYVGVYKDHVEVLAGSFNIHQGAYFENVIFKKYSKSFFKERYLHMFPDFNYADEKPEITSDPEGIYQEEDNEETVHFMTLGFPKAENWVTEKSRMLSFAQPTRNHA
jgi:hypothetical protein